MCICASVASYRPDLVKQERNGASLNKWISNMCACIQFFLTGKGIYICQTYMSSSASPFPSWIPYTLYNIRNSMLFVCSSSCHPRVLEHRVPVSPASIRSLEQFLRLHSFFALRQLHVRLKFVDMSANTVMVCGEADFEGRVHTIKLDHRHRKA